MNDHNDGSNRRTLAISISKVKAKKLLKRMKKLKASCNETDKNKVYALYFNDGLMAFFSSEGASLCAANLLGHDIKCHNEKMLRQMDDDSSLVDVNSLPPSSKMH